MKYQIEKLYAVKWKDHCNDSGEWINNNKEFDQKPLVMKSVGYVVKDHKDYVVLAQSGYKEKNWRCTCSHMTILKVCIVKSKRLEIGSHFGNVDVD